MSLRPKKGKKKRKRGTLLHPHKVTDKDYRKKYSDTEPVLIGKDPVPYYHSAEFGLRLRTSGTAKFVKPEAVARRYAESLEIKGYKVKVLRQDGAWHVFRRKEVTDYIHKTRMLS